MSLPLPSMQSQGLSNLHRIPIAPSAPAELDRCLLQGPFRDAHNKPTRTPWPQGGNCCVRISKRRWLSQNTDFCQESLSTIIHGCL